MNRIDWLLLRRVLARIGLVMALFFGLLSLTESMDTWRFSTLSKIGGPPLALLAVAVGAFRGMLASLPVSVLVGTILGVLDLQLRREFTIVRAAGYSIWRTLRAPLIAVFLLGILAAFVAQPVALQINRSLPIASAQNEDTGTLWLEQQGDDGHYLLQALHSQSGGRVLETVIFFMGDKEKQDRIEAETAKLHTGAWWLTNAVRYTPDAAPEKLPADTKLSTTTTLGDMRVTLTSARDLTYSELMTAANNKVADPNLRAAVLTSLVGLFALPLLLVGSVLIGFAFTSGYRRTNKYGASVLYGIVLGFVLYVVTELANHSGFAGLLDPTFASAGPAFVAIVIGLTVLLYREDGRA